MIFALLETLAYFIYYETIVSKQLHFEKGWSNQFCWNHQNTVVFIKITFLRLKKLKELNTISWYNQNCWFSVKTAAVSRTQGLCYMIYTFSDTF